MRLSLLAVLGAMAIAPASAAAATTYKVTETNDAARAPGLECGAGEHCTLRAAVEHANSEGGEATIELPAGSYKLTGGELWVESHLTVRGAGAGITTIAGEETSSVLGVEQDAALTVEGVTVEGGSQFAGGGVYAQGRSSLRLEHSTVRRNHAAFGAGIFAQNGASVLVSDSKVAENEAWFGGGIALEAIGCELAAAKRAAHHAARATTLELPGALAQELTVSRSSIEANTATAGFGGGIFEGLGCFFPGARRQSAVSPTSLAEGEGGLAIDQSTIANNHAVGSRSGDGIGGAPGIGGGIYEETHMLSDLIVDSTITGNTATYTGGGLADARGQAILVSDTVSANKIEAPESGKFSARAGWHRVAPGTSASPSAIVPATVQADNLAAEPANEEARIELRNTLVATGAERPNCEGRVESLVEGSGYNLDYPSTAPGGEADETPTTDTCGMSAADHDLTNVDPKLDPAGLQDNGGSTQTIALLPTSPAIGVVPLASDCSLAETGPALASGEGEAKSVDQRGMGRPGIAGDGCDIGAYEYQQPPKAPEAAKEAPKEAPKETPKETTQSPPKPAGAVLGVKIASPLCTSKRDITIHIQNAKHFGLVSAVVSVNGKARRTLTGRHLRTAIDLVGLPKGTFVVTIVARTKSGRTLRGERVYHTCHTRLTGHARLLL